MEAFRVFNSTFNGYASLIVMTKTIMRKLGFTTNYQIIIITSSLSTVFHIKVFIPTVQKDC